MRYLAHKKVLRRCQCRWKRHQKQYVTKCVCGGGGHKYSHFAFFLTVGSITIQIEVEGWGEQDEGGYNIAEFTVAVSDDKHYRYIL